MSMLQSGELRRSAHGWLSSIAAVTSSQRLQHARMLARKDRAKSCMASTRDKGE